jgi:hypothetical protein
MSKKVRLALIGAGRTAEAHINGILAHPDKVGPNSDDPRN